MANTGQTSARPLAWLYAALIVYASLYPFGPWRDQNIAPWVFLWAPRTPYWTSFDVAANLTGYVPLGFWVTLARLRLNLNRHPGWHGLLAGCLLSLCLETLQSYLPMRVPSQADWMLNTLGAGLGAVLALTLERGGFLLRYSAMRQRWFVRQTDGALPLLLTWPFALLFPLAQPLGLGQVFERAEAFLGNLLTGTPFLEWLPLREVELQPLTPATHSLCVGLGLALPVLLAFSVMPARRHRTHALWVLPLVALGVTSLSGALTYGPLQAWSWLEWPTWVGLILGLMLGSGALWFSTRANLVLLLTVTLMHLALVNQAPTNTYFDQTLQTWEQGRFIRFNGLAQWLGWLWPFALVMDTMRRLARPQ
ncbi:MAG: hypothetical protein RL657_434 [Pseudomonadota bacterium]|jgi:VanZ family protein